ncbi:MAG: FadR family transcriptional regulator [candidate division KSB1 bacterium]|nr:FadR family transcriptional regulator [candidate division KSB1 bacterium]
MNEIEKGSSLGGGTESSARAEMREIPFVPVHREESLSLKVEKQIRDAILRKVFLPGERLPSELELCEAFGVSRTAVREALRMLSARGLVEIRKGSGAYVAELSPAIVVDPFAHLLEMKCGPESHLHLVQVRKFLEPDVARLAACQRSDEDLRILRQQLAIMEATFDGAPDEMILADIEFHRQLAAISRNPLVPIVLEPLFQLLPRFISDTYKQERAPDLAIRYHRRILEAVEKRDGDGAYQAMREHLEKAEEHARIFLQKSGILHSDPRE